MRQEYESDIKCTSNKILTRTSYKLLMANVIIFIHFRNVFPVVCKMLQRKFSVLYTFKKIRHQSRCVGLAALPFSFNVSYVAMYSQTCEQTSLLTPNAERNSVSSRASIVLLVARLIGTFIGRCRSISQPSKRKADGDNIIVTKCCCRCKKKASTEKGVKKEDYNMGWKSYSA